MATRKDVKTWEYGDFQTPKSLADIAVARLRDTLSFTPKTIIEPTCGVGAFLMAAAEAFPDAEKILGVEIDASYLSVLRNEIGEAPYRDKVDLIQADFFKLDWEAMLATLPKPILFIGNPPWVTNADIGLIKGDNLPVKSNFQNHKGFDAVTGKANFDISESMVLKQMDWIDQHGGAVAMLCKTAVARKILQSAWKANRPIEGSTCVQIDAMAHFGAAVDACFFQVERGHGEPSTDCAFFESFDDDAPSSVFGFHDGMVISNVDSYYRRRRLIGRDPHYTWRSGVKHDCSKVMELRRDGSGLLNGLGEIVSIEPTHLYPLLKSSDVAHGRVNQARLNVIVTQKKVGDQTDHIRLTSPATWAYLNRHRSLLDNRGSVIYRGKPSFSIFGIGPYAFEHWKVAISGFYKRLSFQLIPPHDDKPVMVDDTVYFLGCHTRAEAEFLHDILGSDEAQEALESMTFWNDKRPITVDLLKRLNIEELAQTLGRGDEYRGFNEARAGWSPDLFHRVAMA
jgi:SAM-dependent methyltransferase